MIKFYSILFFCIVMSCSNSKSVTNTSPAGGDGGVSFDKQGHRGCRGLMPENTIPAMLKALDLGVTTLEMDVVITKDKNVVLSHEPWFEPEITTKPDGSFIAPADARNYNIYKMNYDEVKTYDVGMKPHPRFPKQQKLKAYKPLLSDLFDSVMTYMMTRRKPMPRFNIETKCDAKDDGIFHPMPDEFVELLVAVIKEKGVEDRITIQSFDFRTLQYLHKKYPEIKTAALVETVGRANIQTLIKDLEFTPTIYSPAYQLLTEAVIKECHSKNIKVIPWTVNDKKKIDELKNMGVDGIITDYPDLFNE
jgi:glycerophosphoryl diester phosphodiesterase